MKKILIYVCFFCLISQSFASVCQIKGKKGNWNFEVDGEKFELKGTGCAKYKGIDGSDYFALAIDMGANVVRTWGIKQGTKDYFNAALKAGLKVDAGIWFNHCNIYSTKKKVFSYINNEKILSKKETVALNYIRTYKNHPALLMWNLGNEVLFFTNEEEEKIAFCKYLERVCKKVKAIDYNHPVIYTCASLDALPYLKKYVPSLDIIGFNTYGGIEYLHNAWEKAGFDIPYLITELGPLGSWDRNKDQFGKAIDEADYEKAFHYQFILEEIVRFKGNCLGGFVFHLGDTTQESLTWWNLTVGPYKRESYYVVKSFYTGIKSNMPPLFTGLEIDKRIVKPSDIITAKITARDRENDNLSYDFNIGTCKEKIMRHYVNDIVPVKSIKKGKVTVFKAPEKQGIYRLHVYVYDGKGNVSTRAISFKVV